MRLLKHIVSILSVVVLCMSLAACSKDDDSQYDDNNKGLKLSSVTMEDNTYYKLLYDSQNRISRIDIYWSDTKSSHITFEYSDSHIVMREMDNEYIENNHTMCILNAKGFIEKTITYYNDARSPYTALYFYNEENQLIRTSDRIEYFIWENGNITKEKWIGDETGADNGYYDEIKYNSTPSSRGFFLFFDDTFFDIFQNYDLCWLANFGYFGSVPKNLISEIWEDVISYEYYDNGYVSQISGKDFSWSLVWE